VMRVSAGAAGPWFGIRAAASKKIGRERRRGARRKNTFEENKLLGRIANLDGAWSRAVTNFPHGS
jgi:hypothetical protein